MHLLASALGGLTAAGLALGSCGDAASGPALRDSVGTAAVRLEPVAQGLDFPLYVTAPPGDSARLFIVEKGGRIRIVRDGRLLETPFLDLSAEVSGGSEQGLLGLAFAPDYAASGRFFVNYTDRAGDTRIAAFAVSSDPDVANPAGRILLTVDQPFSNHNGGHLAFGPDGMLWIALGDGGSGGDPRGHGQRRDELLGSLLRLDVSGRDGYTVPPDNPFADSSGMRGELWNYGLRNPWRFSWDRATGDLYIADVGQNAREEVNVAPAAGGSGGGGGRGANYGWNAMEGTACFRDGCDPSRYVLPVLDYGHGDGCSITGGYVYRGSAVPELAGHYFYSDFCEGWVRSFRWEDGRIVEQRRWPALDPGGSVPSFGEDARGELYVMTAEGNVFRIAPGD